MTSENRNKRRIVFNTGNILKAWKKAGQKPTEELFDSLHGTVQNEETQKGPNGSWKGFYLSDGTREVRWKGNTQDLVDSLKENPRENIKIATKVFLNDCSEEYLRNAIENAFRVLDVDFLDTLILAYHPKQANGTNGFSDDVDAKEGIIEWGDGTEKSLNDLKKLWRVLEEYSQKKQISQLGISDLNCDILRQLYEWSTVQPTITQINLSACCVVPPDLKEFCNEKEIQLLTHSDPQEIITRTTMARLDFGDIEPNWTLRYQVHVKCRGVLIAKGFIVGAYAH